MDYGLQYLFRKLYNIMIQHEKKIAKRITIGQSKDLKSHMANTKTSIPKYKKKKKN